MVDRLSLIGDEVIVDNCGVLQCLVCKSYDVSWIAGAVHIRIPLCADAAVFSVTQCPCLRSDEVDIQVTISPKPLWDSMRVD
jgi:hypothetical protein